MEEPRMRPVDLPRDEPPVRRERPGRHLVGFGTAGLLTAIGGGSVLAYAFGGDGSLIDGGGFGGLVGWVVWMTAAEAMNFRSTGSRARVLAVGLVVAVAVGVAVGFAASRAGVEFALTLPMAILAGVVGVAWLWRLVRRT